MRVSLLYIDDCPSWQVANERLAEALHRTGRGDVEIELRLVASDAEAQALHFRGSPTIRLDGTDVLGSGATEGFGLSCRLYVTDAGLAGSPTVAQLVAALGGPLGREG